jgi:GMP synthase-like glutamine amidotransferase
LATVAAAAAASPARTRAAAQQAAVHGYTAALTVSAALLDGPGLVAPGGAQTMAVLEPVGRDDPVPGVATVSTHRRRVRGAPVAGRFVGPPGASGIVLGIERRPVGGLTSPPPVDRGGVGVPRCLIVQHVEPEGPYAIGDALRAAGAEIDLRRVFTGDPLPAAADGLDGLVVMGGPMSATTDVGFPTRSDEIGLLADAVRRGVPTLGVCLGAQLLAHAAGGSVFSGGAGPEIGWGPVDLADAAGSDPLLAGLPEQLTVLHWHGDSFDLPPGAVRLASNGRYSNQAFRVGARAWGFQFHVEVDHRAVAAFLAAFGDEARAAGIHPGTIDSAAPASLGELASARDRVADRFAGMVGGRDREEDMVGLA